MSTGNCASCKHWRQPVEQYNAERYEGFGQCAAVPHGNTFDLQDDHLDLAAYVEDGSGYMAKLITRADFGCVLHQVPGADMLDAIQQADA